MIYVKINNGSIEKYPYSIADLRRDNPNTSFAKTVSSETMRAYGVFEVIQEPLPEVDPNSQRAVQADAPVLEEGSWVLKATTVDLTQEEIAEKQKDKAATVRADRNVLLAMSDWIVLYSSERGETVPQDWKDYRQMLRDVPSQPGFPYTITWPSKPQ